VFVVFSSLVFLTKDVFCCFLFFGIELRIFFLHWMGWVKGNGLGFGMMGWTGRHGTTDLGCYSHSDGAESYIPRYILHT
jgi:hypothetical protein